MFFPKVDVRQALLLNNDQRRYARVIDNVEIPLKVAGRSNRAIMQLARGENAMRTYRVDVARLAYSDAADMARRDRDGFLESAAIMLLTQLLDGIGPATAQLVSCREALELLDYDIFQQRELLEEKRTPRDEALPIMTPRMLLLELLQHNHDQYELRLNSNGLADSRERADTLLARKDAQTALNVATVGGENATKTFGRDHWWMAVMNVRCVLALHLLGKREQAQKLAAATLNAFSEWAHAGECDPLFMVDFELMKQAVNGTLVGL